MRKSDSSSGRLCHLLKADGNGRLFLGQSSAGTGSDGALGLKTRHEMRRAQTALMLIALAFVLAVLRTFTSEHYVIG